ncbi:IS256 family transposase [Ktedonobacter robiniae]|uniref:Mutator family transposase n=1 Tax=Ktedonobacter robiniae TaxID=2778365 RepID=A0ABQ3UU08_9CHLR|nr:IS256 family transposase [Ktedonobacter robiniae]GHO56072.1 IS256 family transposase [Ktedonobacter robiniae]GHO59456.1 IS256 family transposase [Ktedonobacter robiniae]
MTLYDHSSEDIITRQEAFEQLVKERLQYAVRIAFINVLEEEVTAFIGAKPYERSQHRRDQRNGHYSRHLDTTVGEIADVPVPRTRGGYHTQLFERYHRRRDELDGAMQDMFIKGVSMAQVGEIIETLTGLHPSASTVSRVFHTLQEEYEQWKARPLAQRYAYAFADGTYFTVIYQSEGCKMPILAVVGIAITGEREVLAFRVGDRENQQAWEDLMEDLKARGVKEIGLWISDGNRAMLNAITKHFPTAQRQRCVLHKMENVLSYVPSKQREQLELELKALFSQESRQQADQAVAAFLEKYQKVYPTAVECLQRDLEACLTFYAFPKTHWKTIRTNNVSERLFGEVKRRSHKMAAAFRNEGSCLLLFYAVIRGLTFHKLTMPPASQAQPDLVLLHST